MFIASAPGLVVTKGDWCDEKKVLRKEVEIGAWVALYCLMKNNRLGSPICSRTNKSWKNKRTISIQFHD